MPDPIARCARLDVEYKTTIGTVVALRSFSVDFPRSTLSAVTGTSGSGKSSLLRILSGLQRPTRGAAEVDRLDLMTASTRRLRAYQRYHLGYVHQAPSKNLFPYLTCGQNLLLSAQLRGDDGSQLSELLHQSTLEDRANAYPTSLSGGEQQRLAVAMAVIGSSSVIIADEPTAQLDAVAAEQLGELLRSVVDAGKSVIVSTHDPVLLATAEYVVDLVQESPR